MITKTELIEKPCSQAEYLYEHRVLSMDELDQVSGGIPPVLIAAGMFGVAAGAIHAYFYLRQLK